MLKNDVYATNFVPPDPLKLLVTTTFDVCIGARNATIIRICAPASITACSLVYKDTRKPPPKAKTNVNISPIVTAIL